MLFASNGILGAKIEVLKNMQLIFEDKQKRVIKDREDIGFSSSLSFHLIVLTTRARSEKQISQGATDDEDLIVKKDYITSNSTPIGCRFCITWLSISAKN